MRKDGAIPCSVPHTETGKASLVAHGTQRQSRPALWINRGALPGTTPGPTSALQLMETSVAQAVSRPATQLAFRVRRPNGTP